MPYTTPAAVREVLSRDGTTTGTAASLTDQRLKEAIQSAEAQVNARLAGRYTVPFPDSDVPPLVVDITRDIAAYLADLTYRQGVDYESDSDPVLRRYQRATGLLTDLSHGRAELLPADPDDPDAAVATEGGGAVALQPYRGELFGLGTFGLGVGRG